MSNARAQSVLLYDGLCGFCDKAIQFIVNRDRKRTLHFAALQGEFASKLLQQRPALRQVDSLVLVHSDSHGTAEQVLVRSDAVIAIAAYLGGFWRVCGLLLRVLPRPLRDWGYNALARRRFRIFGRLDDCRIPSTEERARFLD